MASIRCSSRAGRLSCAVRLSLLLCAVGLGGCAQITPRISHAHLGHALTSWHDTPDKQGLLVVARVQADTALREAAGAAAETGEAARARLGNAARALDPEAGARARDSGYGVVRALEGTVEHLEYAATAKDASQNLIVAAADLTAVAPLVIDGFRRALTVARSAEQMPPQQLRETAVQLQRGLAQLIDGSDANGDGRITLDAREAGLAQIEQRLQQVIAAERDPAYRPLPQKLLFGLIRLPDGTWRFTEQALGRAPANADCAPRTYGSYSQTPCPGKPTGADVAR